MTKLRWIPETPAGTTLMHLASKTEQGAWDKLMRDAAHMPYNGRAEFEARGYKVIQWELAK